MKKTSLFLLLFTSLILVDAPVSAMTAATPTKEEAAFKRKRKGHKKKKGFMWGLFRKNDCGCPNH